MPKDGQKLVAAERSLQMDTLKREECAVVEAAGIAEIADGERASKNFDAIASARQGRRVRILLLGIGGDAQTSADGRDAARGFNLLKIYFVSRSPWKR